MADIKSQVIDSFNVCSEACEENSMLKELEKKTGVKPVYLATGILAVAFLSLYFLGGPAFLCNLLGFCFPVYKSILAIESKGRDDDKQWLTYWVVYSFFTLLEHFTDTLLFWIPFYFSFKFAMLAWMMLPGHEGSKFLYDRLLSPLVKEYLTDNNGGTSSSPSPARVPEAVAAAAAAATASTDKMD